MIPYVIFGLILMLGAYVPRFLAPPSLNLQIIWSSVTGLDRLDKQEVVLVYPSTFSGVQRPVTIVTLTHPAYRGLDVKSRRYNPVQTKIKSDGGCVGFHRG